MKKLFIQQPIPPVKPDRCVDCPLLGIIPKERRKKGSKKTMVCLGTMKAISQESTRIPESERAGTKHILHRPCDNKWDAWQSLPQMKIGISIQAYNECRIPYEQKQQYIIDFD